MRETSVPSNVRRPQRNSSRRSPHKGCPSAARGSEEDTRMKSLVALTISRGLCARSLEGSQGSGSATDVLHPDHAPPPGKTDTHFT
eukprot:2618482-Prymnesium_polylepis.2